MASGFHLQAALDTGAIPAELQLSENDAVLTDMACWLMGSEFTSTAGGMPPEHQLQVDAVSPGEEAMDASWLTAHSHEAAGSNMQPNNNASLQHAASAAGRRHLQPAEGFASNGPYAAMHKGPYQPLRETWTTQKMADVDAPSSDPLAHPLAQGQSSSLAYFNQLVEMCKAPVHQQQSGGGPSPMVLQSPTPLVMLPSMHQGATPVSHFPQRGSSGALPGGLSAGSWLDSSPMQPHMDAPPRLITSRTPGSFTPVLCQQGLADPSEAALAGESPDSATSARMAWHLFSRQAVGAQGPYQAAAADFAASGMRPLQSQVSDASSASHAGHQHVAYGDVAAAYQPRVFAWTAGQRPDTVLDATLPPSSVGQKRKAAESEVLEGQLDDLDEIDLEDILGDVATATTWEASADNSDGAAHAEEQHLQLGSVASEGQVQASSQQVLPAAAAAAETKRPRKKRKTGHKSSSPRAVPRAPVPSAAYGPAHGPVMSTARPVAQDRPVTGPSRSRARPRYQPYARPNPQPQPQPQPQARPQRKAQPRSQAQPQAAAPPSNPAATHAATAAATPAATPAAAPATASAAAPAQESGYQAGQVVWAKSRTWPWWPAIVQDPSADQRRATKIGADTNKVFAAYFETDEIEALPKKKVMRWGAHRASRQDLKGNPQLLDAIQLAEQEMRVRAQ